MAAEAVLSGWETSALASAGSATIAATQIAKWYRRKKRKRVIDLRHNLNPMAQVTPGSKRLRGDDGQPTAAPTVKTVKYALDFAHHNILGKAQAVRVIGDPDLHMRHGVVRFPAVSGWSFDRRKYADQRRRFTPLTLTQGDFCTTKDLNTTAPTWLVAGSTSDQGVNHNRSYHSDMVTVAKAAGTAYSTLSVTGKYVNYYADICIPLMPATSYGDIAIGANEANQVPFGANDLWSQFKNGAVTTGGRYDNSVVEFAAAPYALEYDAAPVPDQYMRPVENTNADENVEGYLSAEFEIRICNQYTTAQTFEIMQCLPRQVTRNSPIYDAQTCEDALIESNGNLDYTGPTYYRVGQSPLMYAAFREKWKLRKKTVTIVPGSVCVVKMRLPLSLIKRTMLKKLQNGLSFVSCPGLTQWLWIRCSGCYGADTTTGIMGTQQGQFWIQYFSKNHMLYSIPTIRKTIDCVRIPIPATVNIDEKLAQNDTNAAT